MGLLQPGMPWPCRRRIFSSSFICLSTRSARSSGERLVFIHGCWGGCCATADAISASIEVTVSVATENRFPRVNFNLPPSDPDLTCRHWAGSRNDTRTLPRGNTVDFNELLENAV